MTPNTLNDEATADILLVPTGADSTQCFHAHKDILAAHSNIFAAARDCTGTSVIPNSVLIKDSESKPSQSNDKSKEVVELSESPATIENLLKLLYREEVPPDLQKMEFGLLAELAEATEKYDVYSMKQLVRVCMSERIESHPFGVYAYAVNHGYKQLAIDAAMWFAGHPKAFPSPEKSLSGLALEKWLAMRAVICRTKSISKDLGRPPAFRNPGFGADEHSYCRSSVRLIIDPARYHQDAQQCCLWDDFSRKLSSEAIGIGPYARELDFPLAFEDRISASLSSCSLCQDRARKWLDQYMERRRVELQAEFGEL